MYCTGCVQAATCSWSESQGEQHSPCCVDRCHHTCHGDAAACYCSRHQRHKISVRFRYLVPAALAPRLVLFETCAAAVLRSACWLLLYSRKQASRRHLRAMRAQASCCGRLTQPSVLHVPLLLIPSRLLWSLLLLLLLLQWGQGYLPAHASIWVFWWPSTSLPHVLARSRLLLWDRGPATKPAPQFSPQAAFVCWWTLTPYAFFIGRNLCCFSRAGITRLASSLIQTVSHRL